MRLFILAIAATLSLSACATDDPSPRCPAGHEECGPTCMPAGGSCCPNESGFSCDPGQTCNPDSTKCYDTVTCAAGTEVCGSKCMPSGNSCCSDDRYSCSTGYTCQGDNNQCIPKKGGTYGSPANNVPGTAVVVTKPGVAKCGVITTDCTCSGKLAMDLCSMQTCTCYDTQGGAVRPTSFIMTDAGMCVACDYASTSCIQAAINQAVNACVSK